MTMEYNQHTRISEIIAYDKSSIEAIASIAPPLKRLKNPILRKVMASRVTVREAAKMGGCQVADFVRALQPFGFQFVYATDDNVDISGETEPTWLSQAPPSDIHTFDVRPIIEHGTDPLQAIMAEFKKTGPGKILCVVNSFVPTPLVHLLEKKQAEHSFTKTVSENEFHTFFLKKNSTARPAPPIQSNVIMDDEMAFGEVGKKFSADQTKVIDVRHLEMPLPMQTILAELEELPEDHALYVHHKRVPVYLLEELADGAFEVHIHRIAEGNVKMLLFYKEAMS